MSGIVTTQKQTRPATKVDRRDFTVSTDHEHDGGPDLPRGRLNFDYRRGGRRRPFGYFTGPRHADDAVDDSQSR